MKLIENQFRSFEIEYVSFLQFCKKEYFESMLGAFGHANEIRSKHSKSPIGALLGRNHDYVKLGSASVYNFQNLQLNDLMFLNSKRIKILQFVEIPKYLNRFIKLWMKGISRRLEYLLVMSAIHVALSEDTVLKGVQKLEVGHQEKQKIWMISNKFNSPEFQLTGAYTISSHDGRRATVVFKIGDGWSIVELIVGDLLDDNEFRLR
uniref:FBA_2 domain-containing protein n=2 Tax=Caenorhabditis tropicalis TaxID=1561998 RepID=A0A1I7V3U0_9PELO